MTVALKEITSKRVKNLQEELKNKGLDWALVLQPENRRYYSGFTGSNGWLVITQQDKFIITDGRYFEQAAKEAPLFELIKTSSSQGKDLMAALVDFAPRLPGKTVGFEASTVSYKQYKSMTEKLPGFKFVEADKTIESFRYYKDNSELASIREAIRLAEDAFKLIEDRIKPGITERELAAELEYQMKLAGSRKESFDTIVAFGPNAALPHAQPSDYVLVPGEPITVDWGAMTTDGYLSDMTRTFFIGEPNPEMLKVYRTVMEAQLAALDAMKPGMTTNEVDAVAREHIKKAGYGEFFSHGLGHGVGLAIHESPTLKEGGDEVLRPGMVVTVEPGIYMPGKGGVRIEDMVLITESGKEILTSLPKIKY